MEYAPKVGFFPYENYKKQTIAAINDIHQDNFKKLTSGKKAMEQSSEGNLSQEENYRQLIS